MDSSTRTEDMSGGDDGHKGLLRVGSQFGEFELIRELGKGGMGVVWEALDRSLLRRVALKILPINVELIPQALLRFRREAQAGGRVSHSGIVAIHAFGQHAGTHFIAQELVADGQTLAHLIEERRRQAEVPDGYYPEVARMFVRVADALQVVHGAGVVHRDIKPSNILIGEEGSPKVADFGLAHVEDALVLSRTGNFAGTPFYMSPEQAASRRIGIDHRTDVFSLGATFYEALTLSRPFDGDTSKQVLEKILMDDPVEPRRVRRRIHRDLSVVCLHAMEKKPGRRYQTMAEFAADLRRFLANEPIHARPPSRISRGLRWIRRHRHLAAVFFVSTIALLVVSSLLVSNLRFQDRQFVYAARGTLEELKDAVPDLLRAGLEAEQEFQAWQQQGEWLLEHQPELERRIELLRSSDIIKDPQAQAAKDSLASLLVEMDTFYNKSAAIGLGRGVFYEIARVRKATLTSALARERWRQACSDGLILEPRAGLLPLARNRDTGLWELVDLYTGLEPRKDEVGRIVFNGETGVVFAVLKGGTFLQGAQGEIQDCPNYDEHAGLFDGPVHEVSIGDFLMARTELTRGQYRRVAGPHPVLGLDGADDQFPITHLTWDECRTYCATLGYALPSESEWEYACRAGTLTRYWSGDTETDLAEVAWFTSSSEMSSIIFEDDVSKIELEGVRPVGMKPANDFGLHDVHGNVMEYVRDLFALYDGSALSGLAEEHGAAMTVVARGGSFDLPSNFATSAYRDLDSRGARDPSVGFRPSMSIEP